MRKSTKHKKNMPTSRKGMSALPIFYGLLALALAGGAGWLFWLDLKTDHESPSAAVTLIAAPQKADEHSEENTPHTETNEEAHSEDDDHHTEQSSPDDAVVEEDSHEPTPQGKSEQIKEVPSPSEADHTTPPKAAPSAHEESPEASDEHQVEAPSTAPVIDKQKEPVPDSPQEVENAPAPVPDMVPETEKHTEQPEEQDEPAQEAEVKQTPEPESKSRDVATLPEPEISLPTVPDPALTKKSDYGLLPIIGPTGRLPWRIYSRPFDDPLDRPRIAIIMSEMGMSKTATTLAIQKLPGAITLSFNPYARDIQNWIEQARAAGHEVLLQLPMEPFGYPKNDPGPHSLLTNLTDRENLKRLDWMLGRFVGYSGVTNQMGSKFTASEADIRPILDVIKSRGLLFLDSRTSAKSVAAQVATTAGVPVAINNRFLDHKADRATIDSRLKDLERIARYTGTAVGIGYPYPVTLERISQWARTLARKGLVLVPVSAAINRQEIR